MISVDDFLRDAKPKSRSKLLPFKHDIFTLKEANLSNQKICEFLKLNGVDVSHQRVAVFLKEQGFNNKFEPLRIKRDERTNPSPRKKQLLDKQEFDSDDLSPKKEFAKPSWVPGHINVEDLK